MSQSKYAKYIVTEPIREILPTPGVKNPLPPDQVTGRNAPLFQYMNNRLVGNCGARIAMFWTWAIPNTVNVGQHSHAYDQIIMYAGSDPQNPKELGGEVEFQLGDEIHKIDKTAAVFIPKGLPHGSFTFKRVDRPILHCSIMLRGESIYT